MNIGKIKRRTISLMYRSYFLGILIGLSVTARRFFRNASYNFYSLVTGTAKDGRGGKTATIQYPEERRELPPRHRSLHRLVRREDESPRCVACMMCETVCPARCIYIVAGEHPDPNVEKYPVKFDIDVGRCVFCGYCVEACPEDAIRMDTGILEFSSYSRQGMIFTKEQLLALEPAKKE